MQLLGFREVSSFQVAHGALPWPWIAFDPAHLRFAHAADAQTIVVRSLVDGALAETARFALPEGLGLPQVAPDGYSSTARAKRLHAFALAPSGDELAITGIVDEGRSVVATLGRGGELARASVEERLGEGLFGQALSWDRTGAHLWIAAERDASPSAPARGDGVVARLDGATLQVLGVVDHPEYPPPVAYELALHPIDDAVLTLAACGQDGTFARVARFADGRLQAIVTRLDGGGEPAGLVGFSPDGSRVFLAEESALRVHRWPALDLERTVDLGDEFMSAYSGAVVDDRVLVDGEDAEDGEDVVLAYDASTLARVPPPTAIRGAMWVGRLQERHLVTVTPKGEPARGAVLRMLP
ncbi:MAG: hypothetical protein HYV09_32055 [Deltaproteobacteria bacterium]|nr:hypothetical protein [Deltaproteobacteria bacterium]